MQATFCAACAAAALFSSCLLLRSCLASSYLRPLSGPLYLSTGCAVPGLFVKALPP